jgi:hypothetical protein
MNITDEMVEAAINSYQTSRPLSEWIYFNSEDACEALTAALSHSPVEQTAGDPPPVNHVKGFSVKPLDWAPYAADMFFAPFIVGDYIIGKTGHWWLRGEMTKQADSVEAAKAAAQEDYKARVMSALTTEADHA